MPSCAPSAQDINSENRRKAVFFLIKNFKIPVYFFARMIYNIIIGKYPKGRSRRKEKELPVGGKRVLSPAESSIPDALMCIRSVRLRFSAENLCPLPALSGFFE